MSVVRWDHVERVYKNDTGPVLKPLFTTADRVVRSLVGHAGWLSFWRPNTAPHVIRAAFVDGANGMHRYAPQGDEYAAVGEVKLQATDLTVDVPAGIDRAWFTLSHPIVIREVVDRP